MPFPTTGGPGRPKGSKNKLTEAKEIFRNLKLNPLMEAVTEIQALKQSNYDHEKVCKLWIELIKYVFAPAKQEIELSSGPEGLVIIRTELKEEPQKNGI
jgi:hypothetical protein